MSAVWFKKFTVLLAGFGLGTFFTLTLLVWAECPIGVKVYLVFVLLGIVCLSWSLATANNSQANKEKTAPNSNHCPVMRVRDKIASDTYDKADYRQTNAYCRFCLHILILPANFCIRVYKLARRLSTKMQKNRKPLLRWGVD